VSAATLTTEPALKAQHDRLLEALRPAVMGPRVAAALGRPASTPLHVLDAKYEPGVRAVVLYLLGDRLVRADVLPDVAGVLLSPYPDDPDLPGLPAAADPGTWAGAATTARVGLLRYRPAKRATLAVRRRTCDAGATTVVAKVYASPSKAAAVAREGEALAAAHTDGPLRLARVVGHDAGLAVVVHEHVSGRPLDAMLAAGPARRVTLRVPLDAVRRTGEAVAALHAGPPVSDRRRDAAAEVARLVARAERVVAAAPGAGAALASLADRLRAVDGLLPPGPTSLVHGDCKPSQVLLGPGGPTLLDLDHCGVADPASDIGTFVASLRQLAVRTASSTGGFPTAWLDATSAAFLDGYSRCLPLDEAAVARVTWYEAVALQRKAFRAFSRAPASPLPAELVAHGHLRLDALEEIGGLRR
jgi:aminoglycoside phosphotransferase (APT) family kinase protein